MSFSDAPLKFDGEGRIIVDRPINWNNIEDPVDVEVWNKLTAQFWLPEKIALSGDLKTWDTLTEDEKDATSKVFTGLAGLDTVQGEIGAPALIADAATQHEVAVLQNIGFMESLSGDTELLTDEGWKQITDITVDDLVAQYEPETNTISFVTPKIVPSHFDEEVYEIVSEEGDARQIVSGGHRVYYEEFNEETQTWVHRVKEARELLDVEFNTDKRRMRVTAAAKSNPNNILSPEDRLKIAVYAEGTLTSGSTLQHTLRHTIGKTSHLSVKFTLKNEAKKERLMLLAALAGWDVKVKNNDELILQLPTETITGRNERTWLDSWWRLSEFSYERSRDFIEELSFWGQNTMENSEGVTYYTEFKEDADFVAAVASLAGYQARSTTRKNSELSFMVNIVFSRDTMFFNELSIRTAAPQEMYCVQVESTFILTRNGSTPVVSGNCVHAKSYSATNATFLTSDDVENYWRWFAENDCTQYKLRKVVEYYHGKDPLMKKAASTILESFLFYSGFYLPLYWSANGKLTNTADLIRLIIRDEAVHGFYIGYKYQQKTKLLSSVEQEELKDGVYDLLMDLYDNELSYTEEIYDPIGLTEDVKKFLHYNANKALQNLGYDALFPREECAFSPAVMSSLTLNSESHDFFSGAGSSYTIARAEELSDEDWDF